MSKPWETLIEELRECLSEDEKLWLDDVFRYHAPTAEQREKYERLRAAAKGMATVIMLECPRSPDREAALRKVREALHVANASVALGGKA